MMKKNLVEDQERWGTIFMGPSSDRESSIDKVANQEQCDIWNKQTEAEYMARVRARAALRVESMLDKARTNSVVIRKTAQEWANKVREQWENLQGEARRELENAQIIRAEAERQRDNAYAEGYQMGVEQAMLELEEHRAQLDTVTASVLLAIQGQCGSFYERWRDELAGLLREAVETSVGWVLSEERAAVLESLMISAVQALETRQRIIVRANPDDVPALGEVFDSVKQRFPDLQSWEVQADPALLPGGLIVESASGKVDNRAETRREMVEQILQHVALPHSEADDEALARVDAVAEASGMHRLAQEMDERDEIARVEAEQQAAERAEAERLEAERLELEQATAEAARLEAEAQLAAIDALSAEAMHSQVVQRAAALPEGETSQGEASEEELSEKIREDLSADADSFTDSVEEPGNAAMPSEFSSEVPDSSVAPPAGNDDELTVLEITIPDGDAGETPPVRAEDMRVIDPLGPAEPETDAQNVRASS